MPFEIARGSRFFAHLAAPPGLGATFQASMRARSAREAAAVVAAYDFSGFGALVDVGGGEGVLLAAILQPRPRASGVLFDRPEVVAAVDGCRRSAGDFFVDVPRDADAYVLSRVIHDWDDAEAVAILATCRARWARRPPAARGGRAARARADHPAAIRMDLHMLALLRGRERTRAEYAALLANAGLRLTAVVAADPTSVCTCSKPAARRSEHRRALPRGRVAGGVWAGDASAGDLADRVDPSQSPWAL